MKEVLYFVPTPLPPEHPDTRVLDEPPHDFGQVLFWTEDLGLDPTHETWEAARRLPRDTTLAGVLRFLGADLTDYGR